VLGVWVGCGAGVFVGDGIGVFVFVGIGVFVTVGMGEGIVVGVVVGDGITVGVGNEFKMTGKNDRFGSDGSGVRVAIVLPCACVTGAVFRFIESSKASMIIAVPLMVFSRKIKEGSLICVFSQ